MKCNKRCVEVLAQLKRGYAIGPIQFTLLLLCICITEDCVGAAWQLYVLFYIKVEDDAWEDLIFQTH